MNQQNLSSFIWSVADLLRGDYKQSEYGKVILPFTVLRRLDCVLDATKPAVLKELETRSKAGLNPEPFLLKKSGQLFFNTSPLDIKKLMGDQDHIKENLFAYIAAFSPAVRDIFESFDFHAQVERLAKAGLLYLVVEKFAAIDLHPEKISGAGSGSVQEKQKAYLNEIIEKVNDLFKGELTDNDKLVYVNNVIFGKLLESKTLVQQALNNSKEQFANSPDLDETLVNAIIDALDAQNLMSSQALSSEEIRKGLKAILLGPAKLYEALLAIANKPSE